MSREYFAEVANEWDDLRRGYFSEEVRNKAIGLAQVRKGALAVDIGAGTGFISEGLLNAGLQVIAVDDSREMLEIARKKLGRKRAISFRRGNATDVPVESETVDYVFANMLLHHVAVPALAIGEMARILKPGGTVTITDLDRHDFEFLRTEQHDLWMGFGRDEVATWLGKAGLAEVKVDGLNEQCSSKSTTGQSAKVSLFAATATKPFAKIIK